MFLSVFHFLLASEIPLSMLMLSTNGCQTSSSQRMVVHSYRERLIVVLPWYETNNIKHLQQVSTLAVKERSLLFLLLLYVEETRLATWLSSTARIAWESLRATETRKCLVLARGKPLSHQAVRRKLSSPTDWGENSFFSMLLVDSLNDWSLGSSVEIRPFNCAHVLELKAALLQPARA